MNDKIKPVSITISKTLQLLAQDSLLIARHTSLASEWKRRFAINQSTPSCETPHIFSWTAWLMQQLQQQTEFINLNHAQEQLLWERVIQKDMPSLPASSIRGLAKQAKQAHELMQNHHIPIEALHALGGEESDALWRWIQSIQQYLATPEFAHYSLSACIPSMLTNSSLSNPFPKQFKSIIFDGFESFTAAQQHYIEHLHTAGIHIYQIQYECLSDDLTLTTCHDETEEYQHLASMTQQLLQQEPNARIGIVSTRPDYNTQALSRIMQQTLLKEDTLNPNPDMQAIAMQGEALSQLPLVQQALHFLSIMQQPRMITFEDFSSWLLNPWLYGTKQEQQERALLEAHFRSQNRHQLNLLGLSQSSQIQALTMLHQVIQHMQTWQQPKAQAASTWIKVCQTLLQKCGILHVSQLESEQANAIEIRHINAFRDAMSTLIALDAIQANMSFSDFLTALRAACNQIHVSLKPKHSNVLVLNMEEAVGMQFDYVLLFGMDESAFPPAAKPQALIPIRLQRDYNLPMSRGSLAFETSSWLWQQLRYSSPHIHISFSKQRDDQAMQASSFVKTLPELAVIAQPLLDEPWTMQSFTDDVTASLQSHEHIRGGATIIENQSACPFRAFVRHRLNVQALDETAPGIEATTKGSLLHLALEYIWQRLLSQEKLMKLSAEARNILIDEAIEHAWQKPSAYTDFITISIEKKRMQRVLSRWLNLEEIRPPFQVQAIEKSFELSLPESASVPLHIKLKADRIDKDAEGHRILMDYKTGEKIAASKWLDERVSKPQLPMYAIAADLTSEDAVTFARIRSGDGIGFDGLCDSDIGIKGMTICDGKRGHPDDFNTVLAHWKKQIDMLAQEFVDGRCDVAPRDKDACKYCGLEAVCRIDEIQQQEQQA